MFDVQFESTYPSLSKALNSMLLNRKGGLTDGEVVKDDLYKEIKASLEAKKTTLIYQAIWIRVGESIEDFIEYSLRSYYYLGASDEVRALVGQLWTAALQSWPQDDQLKFLRLIIENKKFDIFDGFDFAADIFRTVHIAAHFMGEWIVDAREALGDDLMQHGFWACVEGYTRTWPADARQILEKWIMEPLNDNLRDAAARMLHWLRLYNEVSDPEKSRELNSIEKTLCAPGRSELRALYFQSLAFSAGSLAFDELHAKALFSRLVDGGGSEELAWSFLLSKVVELNPKKWSWAYQQLLKLAKKFSNPTSKYWLVNSALNGWKLTTPESSVCREDWEKLFFAIRPFVKEEIGLWNKLDSFLAEVIISDFESAKKFVFKIAAALGREWVLQIRERSSGSGRFLRVIREQGYADEIITNLCFAKDQESRMLGIYIYCNSAVAALQPAAIANSSAEQLELLVLETASAVTDQYAQVARLHVSIAPKVDELGGHLAEVFSEEISVNALNTEGYRGALKIHAKEQPKLLACVEEAHSKIAAIVKACQSPALQMTIMGHRKAERMEMRRFSQHIAEGMEQHSLLRMVCTTVPVLYGKTWRMSNPAGGLTKVQDFQKSEVSMEVPRLEFILPEQMRLRRLSARARISQLQKLIDAAQ